MTTLKRITVLTVTMATLISGQLEGRVQAETTNFVQEMEELLRLSSGQTGAAAAAQYRRLREAAPTDARVPRFYGLLLIKQLRYREASDALNESLRLDGTNLNLWKTSIWLSVLRRDYNGALEAMERLCQRMPGNAGSAEQERKCREFAAFAGQIMGYLTGPGRATHGLAGDTADAQTFTHCLSGERRSIVDRAQQQVLETYQLGLQRIGQIQQRADAQETTYRNLQMSHLAQDRDYAQRELARIEDLRAEAKAQASNERNVIATTRERSSGGFSSYDNAAYRDRQESASSRCVRPGNVQCAPSPGSGYVAPNNLQQALGDCVNRFQAFRRQAGAGGGYYQERGLDDDALDGVNLREAANDKRLDRREKSLQRRGQRITQDEQRLLTKPVIGSNSQLTALRAKVEALATYVPLPVSPEQEISTILATYRQAAAAPVQFAVNGR
jgi:tetratricopeptide (TPR) repeat protein